MLGFKWKNFYFWDPDGSRNKKCNFFERSKRNVGFYLVKIGSSKREFIINTNLRC